MTQASIAFAGHEVVVSGPHASAIAGQITDPLPGLAARKLDQLLESGYRINGLAIRRDGAVPQQGFLTDHAMVGWWNPGMEGSAMDLFKNACRIHTKFATYRYLMSNTAGRLCGAEKAQRHAELCSFYVGAFHASDPEHAARDHEADFKAVHTATQALTDYLDERIGFPLDSVPDYDKLAPLFFEQFHGLAVQALRPSPTMTRRVRYKNAAMQRAFEGCLAAAFAKDKALFAPDGSQRRGSSQACAFWDGANGMARSPFVQPGSLTSACFAAGKAFRRANQHAEKTP